MKILNAVLLVWAIVATVAAIWFALGTEPVDVPGPDKPADDGVAPGGPAPAVTERPSSLRRRGVESTGGSIPLAGFLAIALNPPATAPADDRPVKERVRDLLDAHRKVEDSEDRRSGDTDEIDRSLFSLLHQDTNAHLALMDLLREAEDEDQAHRVLDFLVWNPFVRNVRSDIVTNAIEGQAKEMIARDPSVARRAAAVRALYRYGRGGGREAFDFGLLRLEAEPSVEVRDALLEEMTVAGKDLGLTREEAEPFLVRLRSRLDEGETWCANAISDWSTDAEDFRRLRERLATERDPRNRQDYANAFSGHRTLMRDRSAEARSVLIGLATDPSEDELVRRLARDFLAESFGPMDAESADAVRRYDAEQHGR